MEMVKSFSESIKNMRIITVAAMTLVVLSNVFWYCMYEGKVSELSQKVYFATDNGTFAAISAGYAQPTKYEAENLVRNFMQLMFAYNAETFRDRIDLGLKLIDRQSGLAIYETFKRDKVLEKLHLYNSETRLVIDSAHVDMSHEPYQGVVYGAQQVYFQNQIATQPIAARFIIERQFRSDANPYGLVLNDFKFIRYNRSKE